MSKIGRNDPCPCGSGRKFKRCCVDREDELARRAEAAASLLGLASLFPFLRPASDELEAWAAERGGGTSTPELVDEGVSQLTALERARIEAACAERHPELWSGLVADFGNEQLARELVVHGAVEAFLDEPRIVDADDLDHIDECPDCGRDPLSALVSVVEACDLWCVTDAADADEALAHVAEDGLDAKTFEAVLAFQAERAWSDVLERRLTLLVSRVRGQLPLPEWPRASIVLGDACSEFERDPGFRAQLAARLLGDAILALTALEVRAALAA